MTTYEDVLRLVEALPDAADPRTRDIRWVTTADVVGVARDTDGRVEVFLRGAQLRPILKTLQDAIRFQIVHRDGGQPPFDANRLVFPPLGHFDQVAAFICTELLRADADNSLEIAFARTEPLIELAIEQINLSTQNILGLTGELLVLEALCRRVQSAQVASVIAGWDGWQRSSRDLTIGTTGIEVKTTTGISSSHHIAGVHQVERNDGSGGSVPEDRLFLISVGLQSATTGDDALTLPQIVDRIVEHMEAGGLPDSAIQTLLFRIREYGGGDVGGYDHVTQASDPAYGTPYLTRFFRAYDMDDVAIKVLRRADVIAHPYVAVDSVKFRIDLPVTVSAGNPITGANQVADTVLK